jgi:hypothetical protein
LSRTVAGLIDLRLLHREPGRHRLVVARQLLPGNLEAGRELIGVELRLSQRNRRNQTLRRQLLVGLDQHRRLFQVRLDAGCRCLLVERVVPQLHAQVGEAGLCALQPQHRVLAPVRAWGS